MQMQWVRGAWLGGLQTQETVPHPSQRAHCVLAASSPQLLPVMIPHNTSSNPDHLTGSQRPYRASGEGETMSSPARCECLQHQQQQQRDQTSVLIIWSEWQRSGGCSGSSARLDGARLTRPGPPTDVQRGRLTQNMTGRMGVRVFLARSRQRSEQRLHSARDSHSRCRVRLDACLVLEMIN